MVYEGLSFQEGLHAFVLNEIIQSFGLSNLVKVALVLCNDIAKR